MWRVWVIVSIGSVACQAEDSFELESTSQAIVNGDRNTDDPALAFIMMFADIGGQKRPTSSCSGTLISDSVLLTARHCVRVPNDNGSLPEGYEFPVDDLRVFFGTQPGPNDEAYRVVDYQFHDSADLALIKLAQPGPAAPAALNAQPIEGFLGQEVRIAGFGITSTGQGDSGVKRHGLSTLLDVDNGGPDFGELAITGLTPGQVGAKLCSGDSGGPTFLALNGVEYIMGVNSFVASTVAGNGAVQCQDDETINGVVRVDRYTDFIQSYVSQQGEALSQNAGDGQGPVLSNGDLIGGCQSGRGASGALWLLFGLVVIGRNRSKLKQSC